MTSWQWWVFEIIEKLNFIIYIHRELTFQSKSAQLLELFIYKLIRVNFLIHMMFISTTTLFRADGVETPSVLFRWQCVNNYIYIWYYTKQQHSQNLWRSKSIWKYLIPSDSKLAKCSSSSKHKSRLFCRLSLWPGTGNNYIIQITHLFVLIRMQRLYFRPMMKNLQMLCYTVYFSPLGEIAILSSSGVVRK